MFSFQRILEALNRIHRRGQIGLSGFSYLDLAAVFLFLILATGMGELSLSWLVPSVPPTAGAPISLNPTQSVIPSEETLPSAVVQGISSALRSETPIPELEARVEPKTDSPAVRTSREPPSQEVPSSAQAPERRPPASPKPGPPRRTVQGGVERAGAAPMPSAPKAPEPSALKVLAPSPPEEKPRVARASVPPENSVRLYTKRPSRFLRIPSPERRRDEAARASLSVPPMQAALLSKTRAVMRDVWDTFRLNHFRVGQEIFRWDPERDVVEIVPAAALAERRNGTHPGKRATRSAIGRKGFRTLATLNGDIKDSLYQSVVRAGGSASLAMTLAEVFSWKLDFRSDLRRGDKFSLVAEQWVGKAGMPRWGRILAAELQGRGEIYRAIGFPSKKGRLQYFDEEGEPLHKRFLQSPLSYTRISSGYSHRRFHPILRIHRPHRGIDFVAPAGTPVRAVAPGVVRMARWSGEGGKTVELKHKGRFKTRYHHLSRYARGVRRGRRVARGQIIGYVGSTGLSTGPHLDFRVLRNGRPINPLQLKNVAAEPVPPHDRERFLRIRKALLSHLHGLIRPVAARAGANILAAKAAGR